MKVTFLGTGTSQGIPVIGCRCAVCQSSDRRDRRLRTSALVQSRKHTVVIDTGPDFRQQMLRADVQYLDAVVMTHQHRDHIAGLDDVRSYNFLQKKPMPIYGNRHVMDRLRQEFDYVFESNYPGVPQLELHPIDNHPFDLNGQEWIPVLVYHHKLPVYGYRIGGLTYITDANHIPAEELDKIRGSRVLVINALQKGDHISHFTLAEAIGLIRELAPEKAYLTHISHNMGLHRRVSKELPPGIHLAYDGLEISL